MQEAAQRVEASQAKPQADSQSDLHLDSQTDSEADSQGQGSAEQRHEAEIASMALAVLVRLTANAGILPPSG